MEEQIETGSEWGKKRSDKKSNQFWKIFRPLSFVLRCAFNGFWILICMRFSDSAKALVVVTIPLSLGAILYYDFKGNSWEFWQLLMIHLVIHSVIFILREPLYFSKLKDLEKKIAPTRELSKKGREWKDVESEYISRSNSELALLEKKWTNEEAFDHLENVYTYWTESSKWNNNSNKMVDISLEPLKKEVEKQEYDNRRMKEHIEYLQERHVFQTNEDVRKWTKRVEPYLQFATPDFYKDTVKIIELIEKERNAIYLGVTGERRVADYLQGFADELNPLYGVRFQSKKGTVENDVLLFTTRGVFSLEIKNIMSKGNQKLKVGRDGQTYEWRNGDWKSSSHTKIFDQVNRHTVLTEKKLAEKFTDKLETEVRTIIVIPNENVEIFNESHFEIMRPSQIHAYLRKEPIRLTEELAEQMREFMEKQDMGQGKFTFPDIEAYSEALQIRMKFINTLTELVGVSQDIRDIYHKYKNEIHSLNSVQIQNMYLHKTTI